MNFVGLTFTLQGMDTKPTKREKENHLQNVILGGYVSSLESNQPFLDLTDNYEYI